jgi:hypothetical protein
VSNRPRRSLPKKEEEAIDIFETFYWSILQNIVNADTEKRTEPAPTNVIQVN